MACTLAQKACRDGYWALYVRAPALFRDLAIARADGSLRSVLTRFNRIDVLVIDDWAMDPLAENERRDFCEICEDRYQTRSTILTSQLPVARRHEQIGDATAADDILAAWFTTPIASTCAAIRCSRNGVDSRRVEKRSPVSAALSGDKVCHPFPCTLFSVTGTQASLHSGPLRAGFS